MDIDNPMELRFASTLFPDPTGRITTDNERLAQWFAEISFFRDFVYRNPEKVLGKEFSDLLILFDDTAIIVQMKTHTGTRSPELWISGNLNNALKQLNGSVRAIKSGIVSSFYNELLRTTVSFSTDKFRNIYGLVILALESTSLEFESCIEPANAPAVDTNILSLSDFCHACRTMSTAIDLIVYLELRRAFAGKKL